MIDNKVKDPERVRIQEKIIELEKAGIFDKDVEDDPETIPLEPEMINYLKELFHYIFLQHHNLIFHHLF